MNLSADNTTLLSCSLGFIPLNPANISVGVFTAFVVKTSINVFTCPFTILLNILVMVAVKKKRQLRTKSNIALACLATTDLAVGLFLQPVQIATYSMILKGDDNSSSLCTTDVSKPAAVFCISSSLFHLFLMSGERYLAIKHSFAYETGLVSEARIMIASGVAWVSAAFTVTFFIVYIAYERHCSLLLIGYFCLFLIIIAMVYFNVAVYREVRCSERQNIANQVSLEAKARLLKNKKAFYTTTIVLFTIILCYIPVIVWIVILTAFEDRISANVGHIVLHLTLSMTVLNSLFNPLIYAVRIRYFRVAFIQLLSRKSLVKAEELESRTFRSRRIGVLAVFEQGKHRASREEDAQQTMSNEGDMNTARERIKSTSEAWQ